MPPCPGAPTARPLPGSLGRRIRGRGLLPRPSGWVGRGRCLPRPPNRKWSSSGVGPRAPGRPLMLLLAVAVGLVPAHPRTARKGGGLGNDVQRLRLCGPWAEIGAPRLPPAPWPGASHAYEPGTLGCVTLALCNPPREQEGRCCIVQLFKKRLESCKTF